MFAVQIQLMYLCSSLMFHGLFHVFRCSRKCSRLICFYLFEYKIVHHNVETFAETTTLQLLIIIIERRTFMFITIMFFRLCFGVLAMCRAGRKTLLTHLYLSRT